MFILFLDIDCSWVINIKFWVFLWCIENIFFESWRYHIWESYSFIWRIYIFFSKEFEFKRCSKLLLLVLRKSFSKVGELNSCGFVRISLFVFSERFSSCLICFVIVDKSFLEICLIRGIIWSRYSSDSTNIELKSEVICLDKSILNLISL